MGTFEEAIAHAEAAHRVLSGLYHAGFSECVAPALDEPQGLAHALEALVPQDAPLPQRLSREARGHGILAVVLHDGRSATVEAELVSLAHEALTGLGATGLSLTLRSLGPARALLLGHSLDAATTARLLESPHVALSEETPSPVGELAEAAAAPSELEAETLDPARLERVLLGFLGKLRFRTYGTRTPEEVAARLAGRLSRRLPAVARRIQAARASLLELAAIEGRPEGVLARAADILTRNGISPPALELVREQAKDLACLGVPPARIELAPRVSQDEIDPANPFAPGLDPSWAIDSSGAGILARGGSFPFRSGRAAVAWIQVAPLASRAPKGPAPADLLVVPVSKAELAVAQAFAAEARRAGLRAELDASGRNLKTSFRAASRRAIPLVAVLGEREVKEGIVFAKHMEREEQRTFPRSSAVSSIASWLAEPKSESLPAEAKP